MRSPRLVRIAALAASSLVTLLGADVAAPARALAATAAPAPLACLPPGTDVDDETPYEPTPEQMRTMVRSYDAPEVRGFARALHAGVAGSADPTTTRALRGFPHTLAVAPFLLLLDEENPFGGFDLRLTIGSRMLQTWVYRTASGVWQIRAIVPVSCSRAERHYLSTRYGAVAAEIRRQRTGR